MVQTDVEAQGETGTVVEIVPGDLMKVRLADGRTVLCHTTGRTRLEMRRVLPGDRVLVRISPYDAGRGRITRRLEGTQ